MTTKIAKQVDGALDALLQVSDEIRLKLHLGGMDAKDAWRELEPRIDEAKAHARDASDASVHAIDDIVKAMRAFSASF